MKPTKSYQIPVVLEVEYHPHHKGDMDAPEQNLVHDFVLRLLNKHAADASLVGAVNITVVAVGTGHRGKPTSTGTLMVTSAKK